MNDKINETSGGASPPEGVVSADGVTDAGGEGDGARQPAEANFTNFLLSLATSALVHMGEIDDPSLEGIPKNLAMAKHTIDTLDMLKEKTKGNLDEEELKLMERVLYDLRMRYLKAAGPPGGEPAESVSAGGESAEGVSNDKKKAD